MNEFDPDDGPELPGSGADIMTASEFDSEGAPELPGSVPDIINASERTIVIDDTEDKWRIQAKMWRA